MNLTLNTALALGTFAFCLATYAADSSPSAPAAACKGDVAQLCKGIKPGEGRIAQCLRKNKDQVSPDCKSAIAKMKSSPKDGKAKGDQKSDED